MIKKSITTTLLNEAYFTQTKKGRKRGRKPNFLMGHVECTGVSGENGSKKVALMDPYEDQQSNQVRPTVHGPQSIYVRVAPLAHVWS